jgi:hypothetical protein
MVQFPRTRTVFSLTLQLPFFICVSTLLLCATLLLILAHFFSHPAHEILANPPPDTVGALSNLLRDLRPSDTFSPLPHIGRGLPQASPLPLSSLTFIISSCAKNADMLSDYLDWWRTSTGSSLIASGDPTFPHHAVYWGPDDSGTPPANMNVKVSTEKNYHYKWALMGYASLATEPDADWFIHMDDDTLLFVDDIARFLATFPARRDDYYFMHGPGERRSGSKLGNGGGGFYVSRKLMKDTANTTKHCVLGIAKKIINGESDSTLASAGS